MSRLLSVACGLAWACIGGAISGCQDSAETPGVGPESGAAAGVGQAEWPYQLVQSTKLSGATGQINDVSDMYAYEGPLDTENLKSFCRMRRETLGATNVHVLAVFDDRFNSEMPEGTYEEGYALDDDLGGHLRAVCQMSIARGTAELHLYPGDGSAASVEPL